MVLPVYEYMWDYPLEHGKTTSAQILSKRVCLFPSNRPLYIAFWWAMGTKFNIIYLNYAGNLVLAYWLWLCANNHRCCEFLTRRSPSCSLTFTLPEDAIYIFLVRTDIKDFTQHCYLYTTIQYQPARADVPIAPKV